MPTIGSSMRLDTQMVDFIITILTTFFTAVHECSSAVAATMYICCRLTLNEIVFRVTPMPQSPQSLQYTLDCWDITNNQLADFLATYRHSLTEICISESPQFTDEGLLMLAEFRILTKVTIVKKIHEENKLTDEAIRTLVDMRRGLNVRSIDEWNIDYVIY